MRLFFDCLVKPPYDDRSLLVGEVAPTQLIAVNPYQHLIKVTKFALNNLERKTIQGLIFSASAVLRNFWAARLKVYPTKERETFNFLAISLKLLP